jgi:mannan endo-1,4-beta-mannosidase
MYEAPTISRRAFVAGLGVASSTVMLAATLRLSVAQAAAQAAERPRFGAWVPGPPFDGSSTSTAGIDALEAALGARLQVLHWYRGWADAAPPPVETLRLVAARGAIPLLTWEPWDYTHPTLTQPEYALAHVAAGRFDGYIDDWARALAALGQPVVLRVAHEMNTTAYPWCIGVLGNTVDDFLAAWRHIVDRFRGAGAANVRFLWCPNVDWPGSGRPPLTDLYPGDAWVDLVGLDGYNGGSALDWGGWQSFSSIFGASLDALARISTREAWIAEVTSAEAGGSKADWITQMWADLGARPQVRALVWFNERREADWRIESSESALAAMRAALAATAATATPMPTSTPSASTATPTPTASPRPQRQRLLGR